jgi:ferritin
MVDLLCRDLANEYAHWHFYMEAATAVRGLHRQELSEFFREQAEGEMKHVEEFRRLIQGLVTRWSLDKSIPNAPAPWKSGISDPSEILAAALDMEDEVVKNYVLRHEQAESLQCGHDSDRAKVDGTYIALFLEDQILDSRGDADNILEMLKGEQH